MSVACVRACVREGVNVCVCVAASLSACPAGFVHLNGSASGSGPAGERLSVPPLFSHSSPLSSPRILGSRIFLGMQQRAREGKRQCPPSLSVMRPRSVGRFAPYYF